MKKKSIFFFIVITDDKFMSSVVHGAAPSNLKLIEAVKIFRFSSNYKWCAYIFIIDFIFIKYSFPIDIFEVFLLPLLIGHIICLLF